MDGKVKHTVQKLTTGDIGAITKLKLTKTNDTLSANPNSPTVKPMKFPQSSIEKAVFATNNPE